MKKKVYKFFLDFEKEERWLNHMAAQGFHLVEYTFVHTARSTSEKGEPHL